MPSHAEGQEEVMLAYGERISARDNLVIRTQNDRGRGPIRALSRFRFTTPEAAARTL
jgi:hypothetical protein